MLCHYPGCSTKGIGIDMEIATRSVLNELGIEYKEIEGWACCGTGVVSEVSPYGAATLVASNLSLASEQGCKRVFTACGICAYQLYSWQKRLKEESELRSKVSEILNSHRLTLDLSPEVLHIIDLIEENLDKVNVTRELKGLKVSLYPGCGARNYYLLKGEDVFEKMQKILEKTGVNVVAKVDTCCGFPIMTYDKKNAKRLALKVVEKSLDADVIVTLCPFCQYHLDTAQDRKPVVHLHQLLGLAMGLKKEQLGLDKHSNQLRL